MGAGLEEVLGPSGPGSDLGVALRGPAVHELRGPPGFQAGPAALGGGRCSRGEEALARREWAPSVWDLRVAGAMAAFAGGAAEETIRSLGRWKTTHCYKKWRRRRGGRGAPRQGLRVMQGLSGKVHRSLIATGPPETWVTVCGWPWARGGFAGWFPTRSEEEKCKRCFPLSL